MNFEPALNSSPFYKRHAFLNHFITQMLLSIIFIVDCFSFLKIMKVHIKKKSTLRSCWICLCISCDQRYLWSSQRIVYLVRAEQPLEGISLLYTTSAIRAVGHAEPALGQCYVQTPVIMYVCERV